MLCRCSAGVYFGARCDPELLCEVWVLDGEGVGWDGHGEEPESHQWASEPFKLLINTWSLQLYTHTHHFSWVWCVSELSLSVDYLQTINRRLSFTVSSHKMAQTSTWPSDECSFTGRKACHLFKKDANITINIIEVVLMTQFHDKSLFRSSKNTSDITPAPCWMFGL